LGKAAAAQSAGAIDNITPLSAARCAFLVEFYLKDATARAKWVPAARPPPTLYMAER
jgi:hypothetical protein